MPPASTVRINVGRRRSQQGGAAAAADSAPSRSSPGPLRILFLALLLTSGAVFFFNGAQMVLRQSRVSAERERGLEACQGKLEQAVASCEARLDQAGRERQRMLLQSQAANASCTVLRASLEGCRKEGDKCIADLAAAAASNAELQGQSQKDEDKAARCLRTLAKADSDLGQCRQQVEKLSGAKTRVGPGNEDLLQLEHQELVDEVQRLRVRLSAAQEQWRGEAQVLNESLSAARGAQQEAQQRVQEMEESTAALQANATQLAQAARQLEEDKARLEERSRALEEEVQAQGDKARGLREQLDSAEAAAASAAGGADRLGYKCRATESDMGKYLNYTRGGVCPDDWPLVQQLIFRKACYALPRRRCRALMPPNPVEPGRRPQALFSQTALADANVRWQGHQCGSFACLNARRGGECLNCFNLSLESRRWRTPYQGALPIADVLALTNTSLRIGLDVGGGTGSFAARMAEHGVQVVTTAQNGEVLRGKFVGIPFLEAIALRGLIPLNLPPQARLPFFDGTLDVVHSSNSIKYIEPADLADLLFDWDRVLRVGGLLWFEMFSTSAAKMPEFVAVIDQLQYQKLYWSIQPRRPRHSGAKSEPAHLNCVLEKRPLAPLPLATDALHHAPDDASA